MRFLLFVFASAPFPLNNKNNLGNIEPTTTDGDEKPEFIYGKEENISINKIYLNLIRKRVLEYLQKENHSEIQKLIVIEKHMKDFEEKITTTNLEKGGLWKDWDLEL